MVEKPVVLIHINNYLDVHQKREPFYRISADILGL